MLACVMEVSVRGRHLLSPARRRFLFSLIFLLSQLAWILPYTYYLFIPTSTSDKVNHQGYAEPLQLLSDQDIALINEIPKKWQDFYPALKEKTVIKAFLPFPATCFIWLPECFTIAKHSKILQIVEDAVGPNALLYGMTVWQGKNEAMQRFHNDGIVLGCKRTINFVSGASVKLISRSHKIPERFLQYVLRNLLILQNDSMKIANKEEQVVFLQKVINRAVSLPGMLLKALELDPGYGVFFHGGSIYGIEETIGNNTAMLLQFISGDCKVRESVNHDWGAKGASGSMYMPPVLLVTGNAAGLGVLNDVRTRLAKEDDIVLNTEKGAVTDQFLGSSCEMNCRKQIPGAVGIQNVTFLSGSNATSTKNNAGIWMFQKLVEASTAIIGQGIIDYFVLEKKPLQLEFGMVNCDAEHVIVVLEEGLIYIRAINEHDFYYWELLELKPGSAVVLSKTVLQAFVPLGPKAAFVSFRWVGHSHKISLVNSLSNGNANASVNAKPFEFENFFEKEIHDSCNICASEGQTLTLSSGQAYDPDNNGNCDVLIFMVDGLLLQILPLNSTLLPLDILLIPSSQSCVLWNSGPTSVKLFVMHVCHHENTTQSMNSFGVTGNVL